MHDDLWGGTETLAVCTEENITNDHVQLYQSHLKKLRET